MFADLLKRALLAEVLRVTHVINVTDVGHLTGDVDTAGRRASKSAAGSWYGSISEEFANLFAEQDLGVVRGRVATLMNAQPAGF